MDLVVGRSIHLVMLNTITTTTVPMDPDGLPAAPCSNNINNNDGWMAVSQREAQSKRILGNTLVYPLMAIEGRRIHK
jgi:hypothetical protein